MKGRWFITPHAVRRYIRRTKKSYRESLNDLIRISEKARFVKKLRDNVFLFRTGKPYRHRLIISTRLPGKPQLITVLN